MNIAKIVSLLGSTSEQIDWDNGAAHNCNICRLSAYASQQALKQPAVKQVIHKTFVSGCELLVQYLHTVVGSFGPELCEGTIKGQVDDFFVPVVADEVLDQQKFCTFFLNTCDTDTWRPVDMDEYIANFLLDKPEAAKSNDFVNKLYEQIQPGDETMSIVLMNDFHMDDQYTPGNNADCDTVTCCRADSGLPKDPAMAAGKWGDATTGRCDVPQRTVVSMLEHIRDETKPDAVFWMGDSIPHNLDSLSLENNTYIMKAVSQLVEMELIVKGDFSGRFFATPGNHDDYPQDSFNNYKKRDNPVFNEYAPLWDAFMTDEKQMKTFLDWGYFSQPLKKPDGTKVATVLSINSNVCYLFNFAGWFHFEDPGGMLGWMERTLQEIEAEGGAAILISHVPNYFQCMRQYGKRFHAVVDKYQHVIRFQTNAHEHVEQFQVYRDMVEKKPINTAFWAGSTTTFRGVNPSYQVLTVDTKTMLPVELETHYLNLTKANAEDKPTWELHHKYTEEFNMTDLSPNSILQYAQRVFTDADEGKHYRNIRYTDGPQGHDETDCDYNCRKRWFCQISTADFDEERACMYASTWHGGWLDPLMAIQLLVDLIVPNWYEPIG